ncbi:hypothetical protein ACJX0J_027987, partial [Zea mays]
KIFDLGFILPQSESLFGYTLIHIHRGDIFGDATLGLSVVAGKKRLNPKAPWIVLLGATKLVIQDMDYLLHITLDFKNTFLFSLIKETQKKGRKKKGITIGSFLNTQVPTYGDFILI